jgi:hypothetical protein
MPVLGQALSCFLALLLYKLLDKWCTDFCIFLTISGSKSLTLLSLSLNTSLTEHRGGAVNAPASYSEGLGFKSRLGDWLF